jgi:hypothetical protein
MYQLNIKIKLENEEIIKAIKRLESEVPNYTDIVKQLNDDITQLRIQLQIKNPIEYPNLDEEVDIITKIEEHDLTIKKYSKGSAGEYAEGKIQDRAKEIIAMGNNEISKSGISKSLKYSVSNVPNQVKYQQDTTNDYKPKEPIVPKKKVS